MILCVQVVMVKLDRMHQSAGVSMYLSPKSELLLLERMHQWMMTLKDHIVQVVQLYMGTNCIEMSVT